MKHLNIRLYIYLILVLLTVSSCREEVEFEDTLTTDTNVTLMIRIPEQKVPSTYGMTVAQENNINEVTVLAYKSNAGTETLVEKIVIPSNQITILSGEVKIEAAIPTNTYNRIVIVTNANAQVTSLAIGSTLATLMGLQYTSTTGQWDVSTPAYIPMSGQIVAQTINGLAITKGVAKIFKDVNLTRMLARIDIQNNASANFTLKNVYLYNLNRNGLIIPGSGYQSLPAQPTLPGSVLKINPNPMVYNFTSLNVANQLTREIYTFEAAPATTVSITTSPRIILQGTYNGVDYFYPVDFTYDGSGGTTRGSYMPIVRNHKYIFTIAEVKNVGYTTAAAALAGTINYTNIVVTLLAIDDRFLDVFYNKDNLLAVTQVEYLFQKSEYSVLTETNLLSILTNVPAGWTATYTGSDGVTPVTWLKLTDDAGNPKNSGTRGIKANTAINVTPTATARTGYIIIKAGQLEARVKVTQQ